MQWSSHVQVLLLLNYRIWGDVGISALGDSVVRVMACILDSGAHSHFLLEIDLGLLVAILPVLDLSVPLVDQVVACGDMVMTIVLNALLSVLPIEVVLDE